MWWNGRNYQWIFPQNSNVYSSIGGFDIPYGRHAIGVLYEDEGRNFMKVSFQGQEVAQFKTSLELGIIEYFNDIQ